MAKPSLTAAHVRELLSYDPETGIFTWRKTGSGRPPIGQPAGAVHGNGYRSINIKGQYFSAHRLAFLYMLGTLPNDRVDHRNGVRDDNRWSNLREVSNSVNMQNQRRPMASNRVGLLGVSRQRGRFRASIWVDGKGKNLGSFDTAEEAHEVYLAEKRRLHQGCML